MDADKCICLIFVGNLGTVYIGQTHIVLRAHHNHFVTTACQFFLQFFCYNEVQFVLRQMCCHSGSTSGYFGFPCLGTRSIGLCSTHGTSLVSGINHDHFLIGLICLGCLLLLCLCLCVSLYERRLQQHRSC